jgi:hypothetical protein
MNEGMVATTAPTTIPTTVRDAVRKESRNVPLQDVAGSESAVLLTKAQNGSAEESKKSDKSRRFG